MTGNRWDLRSSDKRHTLILEVVHFTSIHTRTTCSLQMFYLTYPLLAMSTVPRKASNPSPVKSNTSSESCHGHVHSYQTESVRVIITVPPSSLPSSLPFMHGTHIQAAPHLARRPGTCGAYHMNLSSSPADCSIRSANLDSGYNLFP